MRITKGEFDGEKKDWRRLLGFNFRIVQLMASQIFAWNCSLLSKLFDIHYARVFAREPALQRVHMYFVNVYGRLINTVSSCSPRVRRAMRKWVMIRFVCISRKHGCRFRRYTAVWNTSQLLFRECNSQPRCCVSARPISRKIKQNGRSATFNWAKIARKNKTPTLER